MANIVDSDPEDWAYVSEGGATIVFSYRGHSIPEFAGTVLRLRKACVPALTRRTESGTSHSHGDEPDDPTIEYQTKCMSRLIPSEHLPRLETVTLDAPWLKRLAELQDLNRPERRRTKDGIDINRRKGVLATDLVGGNWLAVEIKPKWAFLPSPTHLSDTTKPVKTQTCRFCMHNHLRNSNEGMVEMKYCPLDLFSQDEARITKAVHALWDSWTESDGTVNNLKIFAGGKLVQPSESHLMLGIDANTTLLGEQDILDAFTSALVRTITRSPMLGILSNLQRTLDVLDIEGLSKLWRHTEASAPLEQGQQDDRDKPPATPLGVSSPFLSSPEPDISDWVDFLDSYLSPFSSQLEHSKPAPENLRYYLLAYLLSATFKDCSIIVRLDFIRPGQEPEVEIQRNTVTVIDLDPKRMEKLKGWEKLDQQIATFYALKEDKKVCVDAHRV